MGRARKLLRICIAIVAGYLLFTVVAGIAVTEGSIRLVHRPLAHRPEAAAYVREHYQAELQEVSIQAGDSAVLKGWYVHPHEFNGSTVLLSHGITDNREESPVMAGFFSTTVTLCFFRIRETMARAAVSLRSMV